MGRRKTTGYSINGRPVTLAEFRKHRKTAVTEGVPMISSGYKRPLRSMALACHKSQVEEFNQSLSSAGITGARHLADGTCEIDSREARNQVLRHRNLRDNDAGYGDHAGHN